MQTALKLTQPWCRLVFDDGRALLLRGEKFTVGRAETNDLIGDQPQLSALHCSLSPGEDKEKPCMLTDTSSNGTFVDGDKVHKASREVPWGSRVEVVKGKKGICFVLRQFRHMMVSMVAFALVVDALMMIPGTCASYARVTPWVGLGVFQ